MAVKTYSNNNKGGALTYEVASAPWSTAVTAATSNYATVGGLCLLRSQIGANTLCGRGAAAFDTSDLEHIAKSITSARVLVTHNAGYWSNGDSATLHIVPTSWPGNSDIVFGTYNDLTKTSKGSATFANIQNQTNYGITVNTDQVVDDGLTRLFFITNHDLTASAPSGFNYLGIQDIKLEITYVPRSGALFYQQI